ncbi:MAG TPA: c-type cytochrome biogenesis protein CcmI [Spongiibacteraceae bacterium]|nr:c-type cytochrome biogenesis protein CcmI [Spongiibacteraceae bacterium]
MNFWLGAGLLCVVAIVFVLAPLLYRGDRARRGSERQAPERQDSQQAVLDIIKARLQELASEHAAGNLDETAYQQLKLEQERRLLQEVGDSVAPSASVRGHSLLIVASVLLPLCAGTFYFYFGAWADWRIQTLLYRSEQQIKEGGDNRATLEELATALEQRLARRDDDDGRRRFMLARLDAEFGRYSAAVAQYAALQKKFPEDATVAAQYAQALYLAADRKLSGEALTQAQRALQGDPDQPTALGLLGIDAFERQDYPQALLHWRHLLRQLPPGSPSAGLIERGVAQAEHALGPNGFPGPKIVVAVSLAGELAAATPPGATLFVYARAVGGSPIPLAVVKLDAQQLPLTVTLDDSMAMAAGVNLSSARQVEVVARISASGQVRAEPGDLEGSSAPLTLGNTPQQLQLQINRRR